MINGLVANYFDNLLIGLSICFKEEKPKMMPAS